MVRTRPPPASPPPAPARKLRIHGLVARRLGIEIVRGRYRPGERLAEEIVASKSMNVSRSAYREAIRMLGAKGLLESLPRRGTRISRRNRWQLLDPDVLQWLFESEPDDKLIQGLFELRAVVEPAAAGFAAARRSDAQLAQMQDSLAVMARDGLSVQSGREADEAFHRVLLAATDNEMLASLASGIVAAVRWTTEYKLRASALPRDPVRDHLRVFEAIRAGNADAAQAAMTELLSNALEDTLTSRPKRRVVAPARRAPARRPG